GNVLVLEVEVVDRGQPCASSPQAFLISSAPSLPQPKDCAAGWATRLRRHVPALSHPVYAAPLASQRLHVLMHLHFLLSGLCSPGRSWPGPIRRPSTRPLGAPRCAVRRDDRPRHAGHADVRLWLAARHGPGENHVLRRRSRRAGRSRRGAWRYWHMALFWLAFFGSLGIECHGPVENGGLRGVPLSGVRAAARTVETQDRRLPG